MMFTSEVPAAAAILVPAASGWLKFRSDGNTALPDVSHAPQSSRRNQCDRGSGDRAVPVRVQRRNASAPEESRKTIPVLYSLHEFASHGHAAGGKGPSIRGSVG